MLVTSKVKMSGSEKKVDRKTFSISPKFYVVVVQNNGKEMYKKIVLHVHAKYEKVT